MQFSVLKKFADDTKLAQKMLNESDKNILQNLCDWAETWSMMLNVDICKFMHTENKNPDYVYTIKNQTGYWSYYDANLKPSVHCKFEPISPKSKRYIVTYFLSISL